jgi:hypothetical protein
MLSWIVPFKRLRWATKASRDKLVARLDETLTVERRESSLVVSRRGLGRNPYRPHLHLRIVDRGGTMGVTGWMAPALSGVLGVWSCPDSVDSPAMLPLRQRVAIRSPSD